ncbi:unnamed protein product [Rotaria sordida]|uniref:Uncharacterized protein n=1 Tax=Rotaria sordida TaxID=392033 RepID=A0A815VCB4_9BILA|nr:unnamed protein product [Rotaria sordida]CAF1427899.1 unnamed protein product [Rotaria sordida]CAF1531117.1 unnamed protein product [Rotaria sordida]CAF1631791.1 unnamed protein product [Rotaria sordida]CAF3683987.1 unnamed protein product [Rotaria sordida]
MDTEDDTLSHKRATLQIEFIRQKLPFITFSLFKNIQQLCSIIFTSYNYIYSRGSALEEPISPTIQHEKISNNEELIVHVEEDLTELNENKLFYDEYINHKEDAESMQKISI